MEIQTYKKEEDISNALTKLVDDYLKKASGDTELKSQIRNIPHSITPVFGNYVTRNVGFQKSILALKRTVQHYANRKKVKKPLNILLAAEPGSGKSFLIKQLAESIETDQKVIFEEYHVAAFRSVEDLLGVFQRVQSANLQGELPFILFDEVDGKVGNRHIFSNLLAPMWDGLFHIGKDSFVLGRAVFIFAASNLLPQTNIETVLGSKDIDRLAKYSYDDFLKNWKLCVEKHPKLDPSKPKEYIDKGRDFLDRVDITICIPPIHPVFLDGNAGAEQIDLTCLLVHKHFPEIDRIEFRALEVLTHKIANSVSRRNAEKSIFCSLTSPGKTLSFSELPDYDRNHFSSSIEQKKQGLFLKFSIEKILET